MSGEPLKTVIQRKARLMQVVAELCEAHLPRWRCVKPKNKTK
jgi:hypothetical protein